MTTAPYLPDDYAVFAVVDAVVPLLGIPMAPEWRDAVAGNVKTTTEAARFVADFPVPDEVEPAPVFRA